MNIHISKTDLRRIRYKIYKGKEETTSTIYRTLKITRSSLSVYITSYKTRMIFVYIWDWDIWDSGGTCTTYEAEVFENVAVGSNPVLFTANA